MSAAFRSKEWVPYYSESVTCKPGTRPFMCTAVENDNDNDCEDDGEAIMPRGSDDWSGQATCEKHASRTLWAAIMDGIL